MADFLRLILRAGVDSARESLLVEFVETYMPLRMTEEVQFGELVHSDQSYAEARKMVTTYEKAGIEKGIERGKIEALLLILEQRFTKVPDDVRRKVQRLNSNKRIDELLRAVLNAKSLGDLGLK